jgi:hypothetical protein
MANFPTDSLIRLPDTGHNEADRTRSAAFNPNGPRIATAFFDK